MTVGIGVAVDVVERAVVGVVDVDRCLPSTPLVGDVLSCKCVGGLLQLHNDMFYTRLVFSLGKVKGAVRGAEYAVVVTATKRGKNISDIHRNYFNGLLPVMSEGFLRMPHYACPGGFARGGICGHGKRGNNLSRLYALQPFDGPLVAFFSYLTAHLLGHSCRHVIQGDVAGIHDDEPVAMVTFSFECGLGVVSRTQVPCYLLHGLAYESVQA